MIAAVLTLAFTGVTTIFQARVASDELRQSREEVRRAERAQAARITFWTDRAVHVRNGSVDPVSDLTLAFRLSEVTIGGIRRPLGRYVGTFPGIGPCSELVIEKNMLELELKPVSPHMDLQVAGVAFFDSNGMEWLRTTDSLTSPPAVKDWEGDLRTSDEQDVRLTKPPVVKPASPCS
ncbi:hypothetical protein [Streptomyces zaomyceticus]|uniref:hypothetical protein n=1 Tax=Streptomyces zaomyceticus TaxID=68286 RepID=UPI00342B6D74